jgi:hypothetical protein
MSDQYQPFPAFANQSLYTQLRKISEQVTALLEKFETEYKDKPHDLKIAYVAKAFVGQEIALTHIIKKDIHPNQKGYQVMAQIFASAIWGDFKQPKNIDPIAIIVSGSELNIPYKPVIINGKTFLPIREYTEEIGAQVSYESSTKSTKITLDGKVVTFKIDSDVASVSVSTSKFEGDVCLYNSKTYVSLRAVATGLGFDVKYIPKSKTIYINQ